MKYLITLLFFLFSLNLFSQSIYLGLKNGMSKSEAKKEFKTNNEQYTNVDLGNGFVWRANQKNFIYNKNNLLTGVWFLPKSFGGWVSHDNAISYLEFTRSFFESKDYKLFFEPDYWQYPENFNSKYGLLMYNPEKTIMVQLYPFKYNVSGTMSYSAYMKVLNYDWFMKTYKEQENIKHAKQESTGF